MNPAASAIHQPPQRLAATGVLFAVVFAAGCPAQKKVENGQSQAQPSTTQAYSKTVPEAPEQGKSEMSALQQLLSVFASGQEAKWSAFESVPGVQWRDPAPRPSEAPNAKPEYAQSRSGKLLLAGFGEADLPDGETGEAAGSRRGNEGESGVTLNGDAQRVNGIAVNKFYPSGDYAAILNNQFGSAVAVDLLADGCAADGETDPEARKFYVIGLPEAKVFAEAYVDAEGGKYNPGSTTFEFYQQEPAVRIASLGCRSVGKD